MRSIAETLDQATGRASRPPSRPPPTRDDEQFDLVELADAHRRARRRAALVRRLRRAATPPRRPPGDEAFTQADVHAMRALLSPDRHAACRWRSSWPWPTCSSPPSSRSPRAPSSCSSATSASRCSPGNLAGRAEAERMAGASAAAAAVGRHAAHLQLPAHHPRGRPALHRRARHQGRAGRPRQGGPPPLRARPPPRRRLIFGRLRSSSAPGGLLLASASARSAFGCRGACGASAHLVCARLLLAPRLACPRSRWSPGQPVRS